MASGAILQLNRAIIFPSLHLLFNMYPWHNAVEGVYLRRAKGMQNGREHKRYMME